MPTAHADSVREVRFVTHYGSKLVKVCKLAFSSTDSSVYVIPYAPSGRYRFGHHSIPAGQTGVTVPLDQQESSDQVPKLSIHESGITHVKAGGRTVGPMIGTPLADLRGQHIATISCVRFANLAPFDRVPKLSGMERDFIVDAADDMHSGRIAVYVNGEQSSFHAACRYQFILMRGSLDRPLYVGLLLAAQHPLSEDPATGGVVVIAGWDAANPPSIDEPADYLAITAD